MPIDLPPLPFDLDAEFPIRREWIYLNNAGVCALPERVARTIRDFADHAATQGATIYAQWKACLNRTREKAARLMGCRPPDVAFVKNTTHGLLCVANSIDWRPGDNVVSFDGEFPANFWTWKNLESLGVEFRIVPLRDGLPRLEDLEARMDSRTRLAAISWVSYATGHRLDPARFAAICRRQGALACLDGIQGLGVVASDVAGWDVDVLSADGHKWLLAPEGFGLLFCSSRAVGQMNERMTGWCSRENYSNYEERGLKLYNDARRFEEGSHNMLCVHALEAGMDILLETGIDTVSARIWGVTEHLIEGLRQAGWIVASPRGDAEWSGIVSASKAGFDPAATTARLMERKIFASSRAGRMRFSPHFFNTPDEMDRTIGALR